MINSKKIIVALDNLSLKESLSVAESLTGKVWGYKVGDLIYEDLGVVDELHKYGNVFVDLKLHDIPKTVSNTIKRLEKLGADITTVHALGGKEMMKKAKGASQKTKIVGVLSLTSKILINPEETLKLLKSVIEADLDGVVCPAELLSTLKSNTEARDLIKIVPGIRPSGYDKVDDQVQVSTAPNAIKRGADLLVVGRPITLSDDPLRALDDICRG